MTDENFKCLQYLTLLKKMAACLDLEEAMGARSMAHIPKDERRRLQKEREDICEQLARRVKILTERLQRKDEMLQGYEKDLARLR